MGFVFFFCFVRSRFVQADEGDERTSHVRFGLSAFAWERPPDVHEVGALGWLSVPLDQMVKGARPVEFRTATARPDTQLPVTTELASRAVKAAWHVAGLDTTSELEGLANRARWSGLVPEARFRATKRYGDTEAENTNVTGRTTTRYDARDDLWLEGRLTFRLDRLLFASEELAIERIRGDRSEARNRVTARVLSALAQWQRAVLEESSAAPGSFDALQAELRRADAEAHLEAWTGGWFARVASSLVRQTAGSEGPTP